jgi:predicted DNA repair protein MutK
MAGSSLFALLDDIATLLDDVAILTKVAAKKTAGVLGDDLALNAQQVSGVLAERELPVVWAVAKGSFLNKVILVPLALLLSLFASWAILPLLMIGGAYLCFEGFEKLAHKFLHSKAEDEEHHKELIKAVADQNVDLVAFEKNKIKGAIRTDFVLSAEIIVISLGAVAAATFATQAAVVVSIALLMTVGVYGLVALIVKLDDIGEHLIKKTSAIAKITGKGLLLSAPKLMKLLSVLGTAAMFLVGGEIVTHGIGPVHHALDHWAAMAGSFDWLVSTLLKMIAGILVGALVLLVWTPIGKLLPKKQDDRDPN